MAPDAQELAAIADRLGERGEGLLGALASAHTVVSERPPALSPAAAGA